MAANPQKLEAMLLHLLNNKMATGKPWGAVTVPGMPRFTRADVITEIRAITDPDVKWYEVWKW